MSTLQHTATHGNTRQHTRLVLWLTESAMSTLQHTAAPRMSHEHTATHCNTLQHREWAMSTRRHTRLIFGLIKWAMSTLQLAATPRTSMSTLHHWAHSLSKPKNEPCLTWMSHCHITYTNASSHTYESTRHITHMKLSCIHMCFICVSWGIRICDNSHIYGSCMWDMAHSRAYWVSAWRVTHMNMSYYTYECVILRRGGLG